MNNSFLLICAAIAIVTIVALIGAFITESTDGSHRLGAFFLPGAIGGFIAGPVGFFGLGIIGVVLVEVICLAADSDTDDWAQVPEYLIVKVLEEAGRTGDAAAVCRKYEIPPRVFNAWVDAYRGQG
jgi:uncharacterized membrane protein